MPNGMRSAQPWIAVTLTLLFLRPAQGAGQAFEQPKGSISGVVLDAASGEPIRNVVISVRRPAGYRYIRTRTGNHGKFQVRDLTAGRHEIYVVQDGRYLRPRSLTVDVASGESIEALKIRLLRPGVLSGRVVDEYGDALIGARVRAQRISNRGAPSPYSGGGSGSTDDRGEFRISNLEPGRYLVSASKKGSDSTGNYEWQPAPDDPEGERLGLAYFATYYPGSPDPASAVPVGVSSGQEVAGLQVRIEPRRALSVQGTVSGGANRSQPLLRRIDDGPFEHHSASGFDHEGNFTFREIPPGEYLLWTQEDSAPGISRLAWKKLRLDDRSLTGIRLHLRGGAVVRGRVLFEDQRDAGEIRLYVQIHPVEAPSIGLDAEVDRATGSFVIAGVPPARYRLDAGGHARSGSGVSYFLTELWIGSALVRGDELIVGEAPPDELEVVLAPSARISGIVRDDDGNPASGATVLLASHADDWDFDRSAATTDQRGGFSMQHYLPGERVLYAVDRFDPTLDDPSTLERLLRGNGTKLEVEKGGDHHVELTLVERE